MSALAATAKTAVKTAVKTTAKRFVFGLLFVLLISAEADSAQKGYQAGKTKKTLPNFQQVETSVKQYFEKLPGFNVKGIITVAQVKPVFARIERAGWKISGKDRKALLDRVLGDKSFLAKQLSTKGGKKFAAQIYNYPLGFDQLDRLGRKPQGKDTVSRLIRGPDGYKMIQYMTTTPGGKNMGRMLSNSPKGGNFNNPTGRIYTVKMLLDELKKLYDESFKKPPLKKNVKAEGRGQKTEGRDRIPTQYLPSGI